MPNFVVKQQIFQPIVIEQQISPQRIANLLASALEGGSNYWIEAQEFKKTEPHHPVAVLDSNNKKKAKIWALYDWPLLDGGEISFKAENEDGKLITVRLNPKTLAKGLQTMADKFPKHYGDFLSDNDDATTADVFLQCVAFGDIVYL